MNKTIDEALCELRGRRGIAERRIREAIAAEMASFRHDTGISITHVAVLVTEHTFVGDPRPEFSLGAVKVEIAL